MLPLRRASSYLRCHRVADRAHWMSTDATHSKDHFKILVLGGGAFRRPQDPMVLFISPLRSSIPSLLVHY
jgi:hypothetical protein